MKNRLAFLSAIAALACVVAGFGGTGTLACAELAEAGASADVVVEYSPPVLTLRIGTSTNLEIVVQELCRTTQARCDLTPQLAEVAVEPATLTGTWAGIVVKLLEGTGFNFATVEPAGRSRGVLLISERPRGRDSLAEGKRDSAYADSTLDGSVDNDKRAIAEREEKPEMREPSPPEEAGADGTADSSLKGGLGREMVAPASEGAKPSPEQVRNSEAAIQNMYLGPAVRPSVTPPPPGMAVLPYPDQNGNPIYVPVTGQPITVLPYPDAQGRPIPVAPGTPGLKLQNPFPPQVTTGGKPQ